ncbi:universal stress protein UspC [Serratia sp. UGAL515B_01]|uniref:universal stress protein UspC n=1 Tax=Serratia sp. UGAL515B_01 TaxID=2986763 RepID=UPI0029552562|nr:universal stress protein UspC [Serratia sp. UGAL515B_01]WON78521.1 universal stress protein UspC [Serratia sp. UGAL515B_01]
MEYRNVLVAVAIAADSHKLVAKAVSIVRPYLGQITLVSMIANPEIYNSFAGQMLDNMHVLMEEKTRLFMDELCQRAEYPISHTRVIYGKLGDCLTYANQQQQFDLVICGNHSYSMMNKVTCSAVRFINTSSIDVLIVPL